MSRDNQMTLARKDRQPAARDPLREMPRHHHRHVGVLVAMPDAHRGLDRTGVESPWLHSDVGLVDETPHALPEGFRGCGDHQLAHARTCHNGPVRFRHAPVASGLFKNPRRLAPHLACMGRHHQPQRRWCSSGQLDDHPVDPVHTLEGLQGNRTVRHRQCCRQRSPDRACRGLLPAHAGRPGESRDHESLDAQGIGELTDIIGPVRKTSPRLERR